MITIERRGEEWWYRRDVSTVLIPTGHPREALAGDVARAVAARNPGERLGVHAASMGPAIAMQVALATGGSTLWLREGFGGEGRAA